VTSRRGLSLIELLVSLLILSIVLGMAMPNFASLLHSISSDVTMRKLASAIQVGRSAAITNSATVTLCRSQDGLACGGAWQEGVLIFTDGNRNRIIDDDDLLVRYVKLPNSEGHIRFRAFQNKQYLQLSSLGFTHSQNGNFTYCPFSGEGKFARQLIVNRAARMRFAQDSDGDEVREDSRGRPLDCS
jgi:type IV fimbrial biogenesis protein FimT